MTRTRIVLVALAAGTLVAAPAPCATYRLSVPPSELDIGCQAPCECPVEIRPTYGSFDLTPAGSDPLFDYYTVENYIASYNDGPGAVAITGRGRYRIGGEYALVQQLELDLSVEGGASEHFDSGLVPVNSPFPQIEIRCAVHAFTCLDSVLTVGAKPIDITPAPGGAASGPGLKSVQPNPFAHATAFVIALDRPGPVDLSVFDLGGRLVRRIAPPGSMDAGTRILGWDGRRDDGTSVPPGIYWVWMRWTGGAEARRVVKVD